MIESLCRNIVVPARFVPSLRFARAPFNDGKGVLDTSPAIVREIRLLVWMNSDKKALPNYQQEVHWESDCRTHLCVGVVAIGRLVVELSRNSVGARNQIEGLQHILEGMMRHQTHR